MDALRKQEKISAGELLTAYAEVIGAMCPEITKDHINCMTQAQVGALFQLVLDCISGRVGSEKKNTVAAPSQTPDPSTAS
jgi:hypothetical protein